MLDTIEQSQFARNPSDVLSRVVFARISPTYLSVDFDISKLFAKSTIPNILTIYGRKKKIIFDNL